jgi:hypothetical protein
VIPCFAGPSLCWCCGIGGSCRGWCSWLMMARASLVSTGRPKLATVAADLRSAGIARCHDGSSAARSDKSVGTPQTKRPACHPGRVRFVRAASSTYIM